MSPPDHLPPVPTSDPTPESGARTGFGSAAATGRTVSANQRALWFLHRLAPESPAYNMAFTGTLDPGLAIGRLEAAYRRVVERHKTLRTGYRQQGASVETVLFPADHAEFLVSDGTGRDHPDEEAAAWYAGIADAPFRLEEGRVCRLALLRQDGPALRIAVSVHHIAGDHYALERFMEALATGYAEEGTGGGPNDDGYDYADWCAEQAARLGGPNGEKSLAAWTGLLSPLPPPLDLPTDRPRPDQSSFTGRERVSIWDGERSARIAAAASALGTTPYVVLFSAFQLFLARLTGQSRFVVGSPSMGRFSARHRRVIGYCANPLLLPADIGAHRDFAGHAAHTHTLKRRLNRHERIAMADVVDRLGLPRDRGRIAIAPCMFTFTRHHDRAFTRPLGLQLGEAGQRGAAHDLNLVINDRDGRYHAHWRYSDELFRPETVDAIAADFGHLVDALCADPTAPYESLDVAGWRAAAPTADAAPDATPDTALKRLLAQPPERPALLDGAALLTHGQFRAQAAQLAARLAPWRLAPWPGVPSGDERCVALLLSRGVAQATAMVACWLAGAAFLPLDPGHPSERLARTIADGCETAIGQGPRPDWLPTACRWLDASGVGDAPAPPPSHSTASVHPLQTAYRLQTSGSTGEPKSVAVGHAALASYARAVWERLELPPGAVCASLAAPSTDLGYTSLFGALLNDGSLRLLDDSLALDGVALAAHLTRHPVDALKIVPSHLAALLAVGGPGLLPRHTLILGGETPAPALLDRLRALRPGLRIVNHYGPTETTVGITADLLPPNAPVLLGRALRGNRLLVLDEALRSCPSGAVGTLFVAGPQLAGGYHRRPGATAAAFLPEPAGETPGGRLYGTGDRVRRIGDRFQFLGRADGQVKIRGHRVEIGEVESQLQALPGVIEAAAVILERDGHRQIAAILAGTAELKAARDHLVARLPAAMIPDHWRRVDRLPRTANGKIARRALQRFLTDAPAGESPVAVPPPDDSPALATLRRIWQTVLRRPDIAPDADFFTLGGDSILALQMVSAARREGITFTVQDLFRTPTLAGLAALTAPPTTDGDSIPEGLRAAWSLVLHRDAVGADDQFFALGGDSILVLQLVAECRRRGFPLTPQDVFAHPRLADLARHRTAAAPAASGQPGSPAAEAREPALPAPALLAPMERWFFLSQPDHPDHWNQSLRLSADRLPPEAHLRRALAWVIARHPALTTRYRPDDTGWRPVPPSGAADALPPDLFNWHSLATPAEEEALCRAAERGLSIQDGPIFRLLALARADGGGALFLTAHHLAVDGVSWRILLGDLLHALGRLSRSLPLPMPEPDHRYRRWAAEQARDLGSLEVSEARRYAKAIHGRRPDSRMSSGTDGGAAALWGALDRRTVTLDAASTAALLAGSPHQRLLAAWLTAWHAASGQDLALVDVEEHGRDGRCDDGIGWFTARFPVLFDCGATDPATLVEAVTRTLAAVPPGIRRWGAALAADGMLPRAESCVNYLGVLDGGLPDHDESLPGLRLRPWPLESQRASDSRAANPVTVDAWVVDGCLSANVAIQGERYDTAFQSRLTAAFTQALGLFGDGDSARIAALLPAEDVEGIWPLTAAQRGMLFQCLLEERRDLYLNTTILDIDAALEPDRLRAALAEVCLRHPITRAHAFWDGLDEPRLVIRRRVLPEIRVLPFADDPDALLSAEAAAPFDLATAPLMRFALAPLPDGRTRLVWTRHHLVVDGWTSALLLEELFRSYAGLPRRAAPPRMADYFAWIARQPLDEALEAWRRHLAGGAPCLPVPPEEPAGAGPCTAPVTLEWRGGDPLDAALRRRAGLAGVTLGSLLQFAWAAALGFERGRDDVTIGLTVAGRPAELPGVERMTGVFINSLPLRVHLDPAQPIDDALRRLQQDSAPLRTATHLPLPDILRAVGWEAAQAPFDTLLVLDNYPLPSPADSGLPAITLRRAEERSHFPITLQALPGQGLPLLCRINTDRCDRAAAEALFLRFQSVLSRLALSDTAQTLDSLARHTNPPGLRHGDWGPSVAGVSGWWVGSAILARAGATPDAVAVESASGPLTYGALAGSARAIARGLRRRGIGPEQRVAVALERGPDLVASLLGVLLAGAAYVPLDPAQPQSRIADILDQADAALLIAPASIALASIGTAVLATATPDALIRDGHDDADDDNAPPCPHPDQAAYVIFTSGSTGRPKGVTIRHAGLSNLLRAMATRLPLAPQDRWLAVTTIGFDIAALELFAPLIAGATIVLAPEAAQRDPDALLRLAERHKVGVLQATPASWAMLAERDSPAWTGLRALTGGEALPGALAARLLARGVRLLNVYGPTETTIWSTATPVDHGIGGDAAAPAVPIGGPLDNTGLYVLDGALNPLPPGAEGELWIGGEGLARGYHRRPDLTAAAFLPDPFAAGPFAANPGAGLGARMYRTGDLVRRRADGALVFLGRRDFQVKLRGHRIELGDIEAALQAQPGVAAAVVRLWDGGPEDAFLAAYVAGPDTGANGPLDGERLRRALAERLPAAMVPAVVLVLPALPLNPNGKIDRNALPRPGKPRADTHAPPQGDTELWLAGLWRALLGLDTVGRDDDFFALGGNSLSATRLVAAVRRESGAELPLAELYRNPTVAALAARLSAKVSAPARRADDLAAMADLLDDLE